MMASASVSDNDGPEDDVLEGDNSQNDDSEDDDSDRYSSCLSLLTSSPFPSRQLVLGCDAASPIKSTRPYTDLAVSQLLFRHRDGRLFQRIVEPPRMPQKLSLERLDQAVDDVNMAE